MSTTTRGTVSNGTGQESNSTKVNSVPAHSRAAQGNSIRTRVKRAVPELCGGPSLAVPSFSRFHVVPYNQLPKDAAPIHGEPSDLYIVATASGTLQVFSATFNALLVSFRSLHPKLVQVAHTLRGDW